MRKAATIIMFFSLLPGSMTAQKIDSALHTITNKYPEEKAYIHYDKEYYVAGETIWFKGYLYSLGLPSLLSNNLYLQLVNERGTVFAIKHFPVRAATFKGNIDLPDSLEQGYYLLRALTPAMLNSLTSSIYSRNIFVFNPGKKKDKPAPGVMELPATVQFFPESGNLVHNIVTTVAFKATDTLGRPIAITGALKTEDGTQILTFNSAHDGMGRMQFKPQADKKYLAVVKIKDQETVYHLPPVLWSGINLKIQDEEGGKYFVLSRSKKDQENFSELLLIATQNNAIVYENRIFFEDYPSVKGHLITKDLPPGILHFTVFNKEGVPLVERLSFIKGNQSRYNDSIAVVKKGLGSRQENIIEVILPDSLQHSCSVSITDMALDEGTPGENILSRLLLTDDLKGTIHNPGWYFRRPWDSVKTELDNVMLIHGWSRYSWTSILSDQFPQRKYNDTYLMNITGKVVLEKEKIPAKKGILNVVLSAEDSSIYSFSIPVADDGSFMVDSLLIVGRTKFYYTYKDVKEREKEVIVSTDENILVQSFTEILSQTPPVGIPVHHLMGNEKDVSRRHEFVKAGNPESKWLENVTVKTNKPLRPADAVNERYTSELFRTGGRTIIDNVNNKPPDPALNGFDYINNRIPSVDTQHGVFMNMKHFSIQDNINVNPNGTRKKVAVKYWEVGLYVNEMVTTISYLKTVRADQIAYVKFFEAGSVVSGTMFPGGAIAVYLKYDVDAPASPAKGKYITQHGYSLVKEFYSPDYTTAAPQVRADNRTTLYWNPDLNSGSGPGPVRVRFFNNDAGKRYRVVVEGFDATGRLIYLEKTVD